LTSVTPESKVKAKLKVYLDAHEAYFFMPVQTGYGATSLDFLVCYCGEFHAYECKAEGRELTPRQKLVAQQITAAGGRVFKVTLVNGELDFTLCGLTGSDSL
jgi:hypothetical protein